MSNRTTDTATSALRATATGADEVQGAARRRRPTDAGRMPANATGPSRPRRVVRSRRSGRQQADVTDDDDLDQRGRAPLRRARVDAEALGRPARPPARGRRAGRRPPPRRPGSSPGCASAATRCARSAAPSATAASPSARVEDLLPAAHRIHTPGRGGRDGRPRGGAARADHGPARHADRARRPGQRRRPRGASSSSPRSSATASPSSPCCSSSASTRSRCARSPRPRCASSTSSSTSR